jgi:hypothetical protein
MVPALGPEDHLENDDDVFILYYWMELLHFTKVLLR